MGASMEKAASADGPRVALVVARARNGVIGRAGKLPWRLEGDLRWFKEVTMGKPLLMGRKTWDSLPGLLPGRPHLVLSRQPDFAPAGVEVFHDFPGMLTRARELAAASGAPEIAVIGGAELFRLALPAADRIYLTEVEADVPGHLPGDAVFPQLDAADWIERERHRHEADTDNDHAFVARVLDRARPDVITGT
jgi:dihydrofolate reductase